MTMVEKIARAIDDVQIWTRFNDWTSDAVEGLPVEICRYGAEGEPEIVVLKRLPATAHQGEENTAVYEFVSQYRARAALRAMLEPTEAMRAAALNVGLPGVGDPPLYELIWRAMITKALSEEETWSRQSKE